MPYPRIREAPESSSAAVLQATAAALSNAWYQPQRSTSAEERLGRMVARLPESVVSRAVARAVKDSGLEPELARYVTSEGLAKQAVQAYSQLEPEKRFPAILVGAPNGGVAYLAALLSAPFLPSHFVLSFADRGDPDDIEGYQAFGAALIEPILRRNPDLVAVNHYDPLHDRFLIEYVNHVRLKLLDLPETYRSFIRQRLEPGGVLVFVDCRYAWEQYGIGDRHAFQVGGLGGYTASDFRQGTDELDAWLEAERSRHRGGWALEAKALVADGRESEWASLPDMRQNVKNFASAEGIEFRTLNGDHPEDFSAIAFTAYLWEAQLHERRPQGILIETFGQINPTAAQRSDLLPLWLPFNCADSLDFLKRMQPYFPADLPVLLSLLANFTHTPDMPPAQAWHEAAAERHQVAWIGTHPAAYPMDLASRFDYLPHLQAWTRDHPGAEAAPHLALADFQQMLRFLAGEGPDLLADLSKFDSLSGDS